MYLYDDISSNSGAQCWGVRGDPPEVAFPPDRRRESVLFTLCEGGVAGLPASVLTTDLFPLATWNGNLTVGDILFLFEAILKWSDWAQLTEIAYGDDLDAPEGPGVLTNSAENTAQAFEKLSLDHANLIDDENIGFTKAVPNACSMCFPDEGFVSFCQGLGLPAGIRKGRSAADIGSRLTRRRK